MLCFSCRLQESAATELSAASVQQLPRQHDRIKPHLGQSPLHTLLLFSAAERPQHGYASARCDVVLLFLPSGQPVAAERLSDGRGHLAVTRTVSERLCHSTFVQEASELTCIMESTLEPTEPERFSSLLGINDWIVIRTQRLQVTGYKRSVVTGNVQAK